MNKVLTRKYFGSEGWSLRYHNRTRELETDLEMPLYCIFIKFCASFVYVVIASSIFIEMGNVYGLESRDSWMPFCQSVIDC